MCCQTKFEIFRYPDKEGPFNQIEILQPGKAHIENLINNRLVFVNTSGEDFGYTIDDGSKIYINRILEKMINTELVADLPEISNSIQELYVNQINTENNIVHVENIKFLNKINNDSSIIAPDFIKIIAPDFTTKTNIFNEF